MGSRIDSRLVVVLVGSLALLGCGRWARAERLAFHTHADPAPQPGPFFDRVRDAVRSVGYEAVGADPAAGTIEVRARLDRGPSGGSFVVQVYLDGSVEVVAHGPQRPARAAGRRGAGRIVPRPLYEESIAFADRLARALHAVAMTETLATRRMEGAP